MSNIAIKIEGLSKQYRLGSLGSGTLKSDFQRWWAKSRGKEDPTLQIGMENKLSEIGGEFVYALQNINLEVKQGDILGLIGKNGSGKSTLLKILSKVTTPTTGVVDMYGRVASLLEVGTGFHPELTGRENVFLNGAIMGMTKNEIKNKFDEIVDFSGVEKYIDTPVKRYSSGMYVRLAFGVAAHLEPEILIVDEVLAVGDMDFQRKAIGKMKDVSRSEGRTVLFVSHNMGAIKNLCNKTLLLQQGTIKGLGETNEIINDYYYQNVKEAPTFFDYNSIVRNLPMGSRVKINSLTFNENSPIVHNNKLKVKFSFSVYGQIEDLCFGIGINSVDGHRIVTIDSDADYDNENILNFSDGNHEVTLQLEDFNLEPGLYTFEIAIRTGKGKLNVLDYVSNQSNLEILPNNDTPNHLYSNRTGSYRPIPKLEVSKN